MLIASTQTGRGVPPWPPLLATRGPGNRSSRHAHHGIHLVLALAGELKARLDPDANWQAAPGIVTAPDTPHEIDATGREVLIVFLDPESAAGTSLLGAIESRGGGARLLSTAERDRLVKITPAQVMQADGVEWAQRAAALLGVRNDSGARVHPRVRRVLRHLQTVAIDDDQSLTALARVAGLSEGRFMHAFTSSIGIPLRPYLAWLKLQRAAAAIASGATLAQAAHGAGFADAAHLTRSFRRMLGAKPSELRARATGS